MAQPEFELRPTQDQLNIFVSSRITECADERAAAHKGIKSTNHNPVLFEHLGARSYGPRSLYLSRLNASQIMVAIYRLGYGYIDVANGMTISGIEDEYRFSEDNSIPTLVYVHEENTGREARLIELINDAGQLLTLSYYNDPKDLEARVRDDVTKEIVDRFLNSTRQQNVLRESSDDLLKRVKHRSAGLLERRELLAALIAVVDQHNLVCVYGPPGIGKTTLTAQFAEQTGAVFLRVAGLTPKELFSVCAEALKKGSSTALSYSTLAGARSGFAAIWADTTSVTLVLDECDFVEDFLAAVSFGGGTTALKRVVFTSRTPPETYYGFEVPYLTIAETEQLTPEDEREPSRSDATPLMAQSRAATSEIAVAAETPYATEILAYLSLSEGGLSVNQILTLLGDSALRVEGLYAVLARLSHLVEDSPHGLRFIHSELSNSFRDELKATPQRLRFYVNRMISLWENAGDLRLAYQVANFLDDGTKQKFALQAFHQAAQLGDWHLGTAIAEEMLAESLKAERKAESFQLMLNLTYPLSLMGNIARSTELIDQAKAIAPDLGDRALELVEEAELRLHANRTLSIQDVDRLLELHRKFGDRGNSWDQARIGLELSAIYMASKRYEEAVEILRPTLATFKAGDDEHGYDLAERNLASALSGLGGHDVELERLLASISSRHEDDVDPRRQRAWVCNLLTRQYRRSGRLEEAEAVALEAIELVAVLGDEALHALTHINLGNVQTDQLRLDAAMASYDRAAVLAQRCGRRDIEADASRLRAVVLNDHEEIGSSIPDRHQQAKNFALHAIGLLTGTIYHEALARSYVELSDAEYRLGDERAAALAHLAAAREFKKIREEAPYESALLRGADALLDIDEYAYTGELALTFGVDLTSEFLGIRFIELILPMVKEVPKDAFLRLLGRHMQTVRSGLPPLLRPVLLEKLASAVRHPEAQALAQAEPWRLLYAGITAAFLSRDNQRPFTLELLASAVCRNIAGIDFREREDRTQVWTVVLDLGSPVVISLWPVDDSRVSSVAVQSLAMFMKAFEQDIAGIVGQTQVSELQVQVMNYDEMPADLQQSINNLSTDGDGVRDSVTVTRPTNFTEDTPTFVVLGGNFLDEVAVGEGAGGGLQKLFGLTIIEIIFQLMRGEVDYDEIRPKVVSLVRQTIS